VDAVPEREVRADLAVDVEVGGVGPATLVAVGRAHDEQHARAGRDLLSVHLGRFGDIAADLHTR
jgi:hypothetical protein